MGTMDQDILRVLYTQEEIAARIKVLGEEMYADLREKDPLFISVLRGAFIFMADIVRSCPVKSDVEFIAVSSYGNAMSSSGAVQITRDIQQDITGRHLVVIEDILDSGNTPCPISSSISWPRARRRYPSARCWTSPAAGPRPFRPTTPALPFPTSLWWATAWTTARSTGICPISACSSRRSTAGSNWFRRVFY